MSRDRTAGRWRRTSVLITVISAALATIGLQLLVTGTASAAINGWVSGTYNMQGSQGGRNGLDKWTSDVYPLMRDGVQILALQEAGTLPATATNRVSTTAIVHTPDGGYQHFNLTTAEWRPGGSSRGATYYIYWLETDPVGHRVNTAIVTTQRAHAWHVAYGGAGGRGRPALGVEMPPAGNIPGEMFWSVHALSNGGSNATQLLQTIQQASNGHDWAAMGDWNRTPARFESQLAAADSALLNHVTFYTTGEETQQSLNELDYMVSNVDDGGLGAERAAIRSSDHYPVLFFAMQANGDIGLINSADDRYLGLAQPTAENGTKVTVNKTVMDSFGGSWYFDDVGLGRYRLRNRSTNECLYLPQPLSVANEQPCNGSLGQMFYPTVANGHSNYPEIQMVSYAYRNLCVGEISQNGIDGVPTVLTSCNDTGTLWFWRHADGATTHAGSKVAGF